MADDEAVVPYTCWGVTSKVTIHVNSTLHFHDVVYQTKPMQTLETSWVTYAFESDAGKHPVALPLDQADSIQALRPFRAR